MIDIGPVPLGWVFTPDLCGSAGGVAYRLGEAVVVVQPGRHHGHYINVEGRSQSGTMVVAYELSSAPPRERLQHLIGIVAPHCPVVAQWLTLEASCTPS